MQSTSVFMCCQVCFPWLKGQLGFERLSKSCAMSGTWENGPLFHFKLCVTMVFRFAQRRPSTSDRCRWSSNDLCFSLWKKSDTRSPPLRREELLHGLFFWFENSFCQSKWSKKKRKQANASLRPIVGWKKAEKKSHRQLWTRAVRSIKRRAAPAARSTGRRPPRDRGWEMTFETEGRDRRVSLSLHLSLSLSVCHLHILLCGNRLPFGDPAIRAMLC